MPAAAAGGGGSSLYYGRRESVGASLSSHSGIFPLPFRRNNYYLRAHGPISVPFAVHSSVASRSRAQPLVVCPCPVVRRRPPSPPPLSFRYRRSVLLLLSLVVVVPRTRETPSFCLFFTPIRIGNGFTGICGKRALPRPFVSRRPVAVLPPDFNLVVAFHSNLSPPFIRRGFRPVKFFVQ